MIKAVIDTNVIVSGLIKPDSTPELILMMILETPHARPCLSDDIFSEYQRVLGMANSGNTWIRKMSEHFFPGSAKKAYG